MILLTLISTSYACEKVKLVFDESTFEVCSSDVDNRKFYYSKSCEKTSECFDLGKVTQLTAYPNQNPKFTLCYNLNGKAGFASIKGVKRKIPACIKDNKIVNLNYLLYSYRTSGNKK